MAATKIVRCETAPTVLLMRSTVKVTCAEPDPGLAVAGLKLHAVFVGRPSHLNETVLEKPAVPDTVRV